MKERATKKIAIATPRPGMAPRIPSNEVLDDAQQVIVQPFAPRTGVGEAREDEAQPFIGQQRDQQPAQHLQHALQKGDQEAYLDQLQAADLERFRLAFGCCHRHPRQPGAHAAEQPEQREEDRRRDCRGGQRHQQRARASRLARLGDDRLQAPGSRLGSALGGFLEERIDIAGRHDEGKLVVDHHQLPLGIGLYRDDQVATLAHGLLDHEARPCHAGGRPDAEERRPEDHDLAVEDDQRGFVAARFAG